MSADEKLLLDVKELTVRFPTSDGVVQAVSDVSFSLSRGETLGVVGESGSGKSVSNLAIMGLLNRARTAIGGEVLFKGRDLLTLPPEDLRKLRGKEIAMVFQDPFACLHPMYRVGTQIAEAVLAHEDVGKDRAWARAVELLGHVGIPTARSRARDYPHQFSGGMRQRAMIAMALVNNPSVLIAVRFRFSSPITARFETLLPEPDSPTMPSVSPRSSVKLTPLTAFTTPACVKKKVERSLTSSRRSPMPIP